ncbi:hypothetical protein BZA05DRAFT_381634 [Tricharina praecox]|uniref:uncharacterized protein n=1 Tax=Tricharina praecox TaxID=43433 RepID=UPI00221F1327|nr:uncharacterized protein BZA05DRAFT_381634 [Tricharina praecox]KAI5858556.1 hypothetical protein BZA05DRAFT_381634 [Tricharina praecox]
MPPPPGNHATLAYAATASLAAVTLVYVFGPTWFIDTTAEGSSKNRRKGVVGLENPANDCFINSILQALAGLEDLRTYLSQRTTAAKQQRGENCENELLIDRKPFLTAALKEILDSLNERPIYRKKTISNRPFLNTLEKVFMRRISRAQQDAHEFLQVVAETLAEEHHRLKKLERQGKVRAVVGRYSLEDVTELGEEMVIINGPEPENEEEQKNEEADFVGMPLEGRMVSEIECQKCGFKPKPTVSSFVVLTLPVPQKNSASLTECIEGTLSVEYIDDFACAGCKVRHAIAILTRKLETSPNRADIETTISRLEHALESDPESVPEDIVLPDAPKSRIARRTRIQDYPEIIALHLSRSIYDTYASRKNGAKVSFEETLQMGGITDRRNYRLLCMVTHKGGHDSGHYECFRRQIVARPPFSVPTPGSSLPPTPLVSTPLNTSSVHLDSPGPSRPMSRDTLLSPNSTARSSLAFDAGSKPTPPTSIYQTGGLGAELSRSVTPTPSETERRTKAAVKKLKRKRANDRWWRISDDKIKEARTSDVLGMQREVYLLFYQRERSESTW